MNRSIIVSRYKEDLTWLKKYNNFKRIIYNKGSLIQQEGFDEVINLPNVGRESHTWLYHIVENYYKLDQYNIFLQGRIDDLGCMAFQNPELYLPSLECYGFSVSRLGLLGPLHWKDDLGIEKDVRYKESWVNGSMSRSEIGFRAFAKSICPKIPLFVATSYGGCFAVSKDIVLSRPRSFYSCILERLSKHPNPIEGHYLERLWCYIFTKNKFLFRSIKDVIKTKIERII